MQTLDRLEAELRRLGEATYALAAVGAALRVRSGGPAAHGQVEPYLRAAVETLLGCALEQLSTDQVASALATVGVQFEQAGELFANPDRPPVWAIEDPRMLQAQGNASATIVEYILQLASERPALHSALAGRLLDVGTGVAAFALKAAERCPTLAIVGLDIWEPALALARANVAASQDVGRIEIRAQDVLHFEESAAYTVAWFPSPFFQKAATEAALDRLADALMPGGYLIVGRYAIPPEPIAAALAGLRLVRSGGHLWDLPEMERQLRQRGFVDVESHPGPNVVELTIGRRRPLPVTADAAT